MLEQPLLRMLEPARRVVIAGAGGGFDVFSGLPLFFGLRSAASRSRWRPVVLVPGRSDAPHWARGCTRSPPSPRQPHYFPERELARGWSGRARRAASVLRPPGRAPTVEAWRLLAERTKRTPSSSSTAAPTADARRRGGLGTPAEDVTSILSPRRWTPSAGRWCPGFGVDAFTRLPRPLPGERRRPGGRGAYLGSFASPWTCRGQALRGGVEHAEAQTRAREHRLRLGPLRLRGWYGNRHRLERTRAPDEAVISPLMAQYWAFELGAVARRVLSRPHPRHGDLRAGVSRIERFHSPTRPDRRRFRFDLPEVLRREVPVGSLSTTAG